MRKKMKKPTLVMFKHVRKYQLYRLEFYLEDEKDALVDKQGEV